MISARAISSSTSISAPGHERAVVGDVRAVPARGGEPVLRPEQRARPVDDAAPLDDHPARRDPPLAVAALEPVEVAPARDVGDLAVALAREDAEDVALGVRGVAVDLDRLRRDVVLMARGTTSRAGRWPRR